MFVSVIRQSSKKIVICQKQKQTQIGLLDGFASFNFFDYFIVANFLHLEKGGTMVLKIPSQMQQNKKKCQKEQSQHILQEQQQNHQSKQQQTEQQQPITEQRKHHHLHQQLHSIGKKS